MADSSQPRTSGSAMAANRTSVWRDVAVGGLIVVLGLGVFVVLVSRNRPFLSVVVWFMTNVFLGWLGQTSGRSRSDRVPGLAVTVRLCVLIGAAVYLIRTGHPYGATAVLAWLPVTILGLKRMGESTYTLGSAAQKGDLGRIDSALSEGVRIDARTAGGVTALMRASQRREGDAVSKLLDAGAEIDLQNGEGLTALMLAVRSDSVEIVDLLLTRGARVEIRDASERTAR